MYESTYTEYKGQMYRSRTEAQWAAVFDALEADAKYESGVFDVGCGSYCPDFRLRNCWVEVKPLSGPRDVLAARKIERFASIQSDPVYVFCGRPEFKMFSDGWRPCNFGVYLATEKTWENPIHRDRVTLLIGLAGYSPPEFVREMGFSAVADVITQTMMSRVRRIEIVKNGREIAEQILQGMQWTRLGDVNNKGGPTK